MRRDKTTAKRGSTAESTNKSAFVRGLPPDMPAKEVVEKAKVAGMKLSSAYVYSIRTASKARARKAAAVADPRGLRRASTEAIPNTSPPSDVQVEDLLLAVAAELGLSRAIGLLQAEQQKVRSVIGR